MCLEKPRVVEQVLDDPDLSNQKAWAVCPGCRQPVLKKNAYRIKGSYFHEECVADCVDGYD